MAKRKNWSKTIEEHGIQVRIFEKVKVGGVLYREVRGFSGKADSKDRKSLGHRDKELAEKQAKALAKELATGRLTGRSLSTLTLGQVFDAYFRDRAPELSARWHRAAETRRGLFLEAWGPDKNVGDIGQSDLDRFKNLRMSGKLMPEETRVTNGVRAGTVEADIRWLSTVFGWAHGVKVDGQPMVASNPLDGLARPEEKNVRRPQASHHRFLATMEVADEVDPMGRLRAMLALARFTGRRVRSICNLRADDLLRDEEVVGLSLASLGLDESAAVHYPYGGLRWRAESDKQGFESVTPLSVQGRRELDRYLAQMPRLGDLPLFPAPKDSTAPIRADTAGNWLTRAEKLAGLPKLAGGRWHPYRRLFATELRTIPVHDVAAAGGWRSVETVQRIYQRAEPSGVLSAVQAIGGPDH